MYFLFYRKYCSFLLYKQSLAKCWCSCICCLPTRLKGMHLGSPIPGNSDHRVSEADLGTVSTNNKQSWNSAGPCAQENQPHTNSHHGRRRKTKSSKNKLRGEKGRLRSWLHSDWPPHEQWETKPEKEKLPETCQGKGRQSPDLREKQGQRPRALIPLRKEMALDHA